MTRAPGSARPCHHSDESADFMAVFDDWRIGIFDGDGVFDVSDVFDAWQPKPEAINDCIAEWQGRTDDIRRAVSDGVPRDLDAVRLRPPVPAPHNLFGAPVNFHAHKGEVVMDRSTEAAAEADARDRGFFVLTPSSIIGPDDAIELPKMPDREFAYEGEVAFVVGAPTRGTVSADEAWDRIFGLTGFVDVTLRPSSSRTEERSMRKSFYSFNPIGPWVMVAAGQPRVDAISLDLSVNGQSRQTGSLSDLIRPVEELLSAGSDVIPLRPGDVFATGTPSGVGPIVAGDTVTLHVCPIGEMSLPVVERGW